MRLSARNRLGAIELMLANDRRAVGRRGTPAV